MLTHLTEAVLAHCFDPAGGSDDDEGLGAAARWKRLMADRANAIFANRGADLQAFIYGRRAVAEDGAAGMQMDDEDDGGAAAGSDGSDDELFVIKCVRPGGVVVQCEQLMPCSVACDQVPTVMHCSDCNGRLHCFSLLATSESCDQVRPDGLVVFFELLMCWWRGVCSTARGHMS